MNLLQLTLPRDKWDVAFVWMICWVSVTLDGDQVSVHLRTQRPDVADRVGCAGASGCKSRFIVEHIDTAPASVQTRNPHWLWFSAAHQSTSTLLFLPKCTHLATCSIPQHMAFLCARAFRNATEEEDCTLKGVFMVKRPRLC